MIKSRIIPALLAAAAAFPLAFSGVAHASSEGHVENHAFSFEGPFGTYDKHQLQRGFQIYHEVCRDCHGMRYVAFGSLGSETGPAFPEEQVKAISAIYDVPAEVGEPFIARDGSKSDAAEPGDVRPGKPSDKFPRGTFPGAPDLSLMAKARAGFHGPMGLGLSQLVNGMGGAEYIFSIMTGYHEEPECAAGAEMEGTYNAAFASGGYPDSCKIFEDDGEGGKKEVGRMAPGSWIAMPPPLSDGRVEYVMHGEGEGHGAEAPEATVEQMAEDVSAFLMWAAEPQMVDRKKSGFQYFIVLLTLTVLLYFTNKALWAKVKRKE